MPWLCNLLLFVKRMEKVRARRRYSIGFLIPRLGITDRGAETFVYGLAKCLAKDFQIVIWTGKGKDTRLTRELMELGVTIKNCFALPAQFFPRWGFLSKMHLGPDEIEMLTFSVVSIPSLIFTNCKVLLVNNGAWGCFICRLLKIIRKTPFIYISHGGIDTFAARLEPDRYVAINPEIETFVNRHFPDIKTALIPNGIDLTRFSKSNLKVRPNLERPIFLCVGACVPEKRMDLAIWAVSKLKKGSLLILGDGPLKKDIKTLGEKILGVKRFMIKSVSYKEMPRYYRLADVFTLPSYQEPFGVVYLEAMASGLIVVAPDDERRKFIINGAGVLCDVENPDKYAKNLLKASKLRLGKIPIAQATKFSWDIVSKKYKESILEVINEYT